MHKTADAQNGRRTKRQMHKTAKGTKRQKHKTAEGTKWQKAPNGTFSGKCTVNIIAKIYESQEGGVKTA
jgi:hypothetical protein